MRKKHIENYRGFDIWKIDRDIHIYKNSFLVKRIEFCKVVSAAKAEIDCIINRHYKWNSMPKMNDSIVAGNFDQKIAENLRRETDYYEIYNEF